MRRNIFRIAGVFLVVIILAVSAFVWASGSKKNLMTYESAMQDNKPFIVMFYAPWCSYCHKFMPTYEDLSVAYKGKYNFVTINGEDAAYYSVARDYAVGVYPTIYIIDPTIDNRILINNTLLGDVNKVKAEFDRYLRIRAMIKQ